MASRSMVTLMCFLHGPTSRISTCCGSLAASWLPWRWGYGSYINPYCAAAIPIGDAFLDYSQPLAVYQPAAYAAARPSPQPVGKSRSDRKTFPESM